MDLHTLPERIKAHKSALVNIVTPPICTERAEAYTGRIRQMKTNL